MHCHEDSWNHREQPKPVSRQKYSYKMYYCPKSENLNLQRFGHFALCRVLRSGTTVSGLSMASPDDGSDGLPDSDDEGGERRRNQWVDKPRGAMIFLWLFAVRAKSANEIDEIVSHWFNMLWRSVNEKRWRADWLSYWIALDFFFCRDTSFLQDVISRTKCKWNIGGN